MAFEQVLTALKQLGFFDFLLPWLFTFAVVYGLLTVANIFKGDKRINVALALIVAFFTIGYSGQLLSNFFISLFGGASIILAGILVVVLFVAMIGKDPKDLAKSGTVVVLVLGGIVLWLLSIGAARGVGFLPLLSPDLIAFMLVIVVIVMAVWLMVREKGAEGGGGGTKEEK